MPRFRHILTGSHVNVSAEKAKTLGAALEPLDGTVDEPPAKSAKKAVWVDYAIGRGMDRDEADAATRADLIDQFG
jgi:hypothetical protein